MGLSKVISTLFGVISRYNISIVTRIITLTKY